MLTHTNIYRHNHEHTHTHTVHTHTHTHTQHWREGSREKTDQAKHRGWCPQVDQRRCPAWWGWWCRSACTDRCTLLPCCASASQWYTSPLHSPAQRGFTLHTTTDILCGVKGSVRLGVWFYCCCCCCCYCTFQTSASLEEIILSACSILWHCHIISPCFFHLINPDPFLSNSCVRYKNFIPKETSFNKPGLRSFISKECVWTDKYYPQQSFGYNDISGQMKREHSFSYYIHLTQRHQCHEASRLTRFRRIHLFIYQSQSIFIANIKQTLSCMPVMFTFSPSWSSEDSILTTRVKPTNVFQFHWWP